MALWLLEIHRSGQIRLKLGNNCLEEHCVQTNCLQCEIGNWPNCRYADIKRQGLQKAKERGTTNA